MDLRELTTIRVGGPAAEFFAPATADQLVETAREVWAAGDDWIALGGGSNLVVADDGVPGTVIHVVTRGIERLPGESVVLRVQAGESWDDLVALTVEQGLAGIEALSGIPGSCGAAPIQNIGAYGQELSSSLVSIEFLDYLSGELLRLPAAELELGYRRSALKGGRAGIVISIDLAVAQNDGALSDPIDYDQLATALGVSVGDRLPVAEVRSAVLALRGAKGMILDPADPDSVSAGSFFTNPIVSAAFSRSLPPDVPRWPAEDGPSATAAPRVTPLESYVPGHLAPRTVSAASGVKLSAAWLIEHSGVTRGFRLPGSRAAISSKHSLAIVNTGGATAAQVAELARYIQTRVLSAYGVVLQPEPVLVGVHV
ncbi:UDP-N-acetylmuramate dehydrogenase [Lacisediminihabitans sp. H27-G8]|uniref:UDP-N-acetylmuramate dehydrogenase n=1 Tax=Lacisediminihabitans sp. H27-G8 TaxID=3111909 RepID=UPI0038FC262A